MCARVCVRFIGKYVCRLSLASQSETHYLPQCGAYFFNSLFILSISFSIDHKLIDVNETLHTWHTLFSVMLLIDVHDKRNWIWIYFDKFHKPMITSSPQARTAFEQQKDHLNFSSGTSFSSKGHLLVFVCSIYVECWRHRSNRKFNFDGTKLSHQFRRQKKCTRLTNWNIESIV